MEHPCLHDFYTRLNKLREVKYMGLFRSGPNTTSLYIQMKRSTCYGFISHVLLQRPRLIRGTPVFEKFNNIKGECVEEIGRRV